MSENKKNKKDFDADVITTKETEDQVLPIVKEEKVHTEEVIAPPSDILDELNISNESVDTDFVGKLDKESFKEKIRKSFHSRKFIGGAYATVISAIVIVVVILINVFASELDLKIDVSKDGMYTITDVTRDYTKGIKDDITLYYMVQTGNEDSTFTEVAEKYTGLSSHIKLEYKDPVLYPNFSKQYVDDAVTDNSIIVVNNTNGRTKYIDNSDMLVTEVDYTTYSTSVTGLDIEGQITSALQYVTTEDLPVMYMVQGHGETELGTTLAGSLAKVNVTTNTLSTLTTDTIPEDCSILLINGPTTDYSEEEVAMVKDYLTKGGNAIILADYRAKDLANFNGLLNYYGVELVNGIVIEGDTNYYTGQYPNTLVPDLAYQEITDSLSSANVSVVVPTATGIKTMDSVRSTVTVTPLLTTSDSAYSKVDINSTTVDKESSDIDGPFDLGVAITENYNDIETKLVVYGSVYLTDESFVSYPSIGNLDLFLNSVNYTAGKVEALAVRTRSIEQAYLTLNAAQVNFLAPVIVAVIPVIILGIGGFICIRRRKK
jgi:ABC-2 type transport system permease protein